MPGDNLDFSFSGLKTAVVNHVRQNPDVAAEDVAASFQEAVVDVLVAKARRAADEVGARGMALGGGVAANSRLREAFLAAAEEDGRPGYVPSRAMCTDNAAMVASCGWYRWQADGALGPRPRRRPRPPARLSRAGTRRGARLVRTAMTISSTTARRMRLAAAGAGVAVAAGVTLAAASGAQPVPTTAVPATTVPTTAVPTTTVVDVPPETVLPPVEVPDPPILPDKVLPYDVDDCPGCGLG